ncbi:uncharacterized protein LOC111361814 [Spodoptera litura]|uniref:Uncharacterized protein LOC111361814 n=1 Tax=Spodoptera litura TaxID=69820 RepID=A0A9J7J294_SPOLT|nr:uncharacterized protein LOC111361814 [Spodoptera litura]
MTSNTVKCANCNVVIDELLSFIVNKIDVMDHDSLLRLCVTAFNSEEVEKSKKLLFDSITTDIRNIKRKGKGESKMQKDLDDIVIVIKSIDPEIMPVFVAKDLQKLPPVTFDHIDVTGLLKKLLLISSQVKDIQESYVSKELLESKLSSFTLDSESVKDKEKKIVYIAGSGPVTLKSAVEVSQAQVPLDKGGRGPSHSHPLRTDAHECESMTMSPSDDALIDQNELAIRAGERKQDKLTGLDVNNSVATVLNRNEERSPREQTSFVDVIRRDDGCR